MMNEEAMNYLGKVDDPGVYVFRMCKPVPYEVLKRIQKNLETTIESVAPASKVIVLTADIELLDDRKKYDDMIADFKRCLDIQCADGNWNYDPYMHGMANGMIFALSCMEGKTPEYLDAPEEWLCDKKVDPQITE